MIGRVKRSLRKRGWGGAWATSAPEPAFRPVASGERIRIMFLVLTPEVWPSLEPVWRSASRDERFDCRVVLLMSTQVEVASESLAKAKAMLEAAGVPFELGEKSVITAFRPHVLFYPLPYASLYPKDFRPDAIARHGIRIAYVPYGLEVGGGAFNARYQYDMEIARKAWRIFARSETQCVSFGRHCSSGSGHVVVTGHPRTETNQGVASPGAATPPSKANQRPVILWTPHFTVLGRRKWSSFLDHQGMILAEIDARPDLFFLVRPHPFLKAKLAAHPNWGASRVEAWFADLDRRDNAQVDSEIDYHAAFAASSAILADAGSFLVEYLQTGKPICYLTGSDDIGLSEEVRALDCFYPGATGADISEFLDRISAGDDPLAPARARAERSYFGINEESPSEQILNEIAHAVTITKAPERRDPARSERHEAAFRYWIRAKTTFLAPPDYYSSQERLLVELLEAHASGRFAADVGCGNGRFTEVIARFYDFVEATDPNPALITEADENAAAKGIENIAYTVDRLEETETLSSYDLVSCMGVLSGLVDDDVFRRSIWRLKAAMRQDGRLLLKESLSLGEPESIDWNGYTAVYRNIDAYLGAFEAAGLVRIDERVVSQDEDKGRTNRLFLLKAVQ